MWITNGGVANWYFVLAKTGESARDGFTAFIVDGDSPGLSPGKKVRVIFFFFVNNLQKKKYLCN